MTEAEILTGEAFMRRLFGVGLIKIPYREERWRLGA